MDNILVALDKKAANKISSKKLNNNKQDEVAKLVYKILSLKFLSKN